MTLQLLKSALFQMTASTPGPGGPNGMDEAELRAKITEELGDAIGFLEVGDFLFLKWSWDEYSSLL